MCPSAAYKIFLQTGFSAVAGVAPPLSLSTWLVTPLPPLSPPHLLVGWPGWLAAPPLPSSGTWVSLLAAPSPLPWFRVEEGGGGAGEGWGS